MWVVGKESFKVSDDSVVMIDGLQILTVIHNFRRRIYKFTATLWELDLKHVQF